MACKVPPVCVPSLNVRTSAYLVRTLEIVILGVLRVAFGLLKAEGTSDPFTQSWPEEEAVCFVPHQPTWHVRAVK